MTTRRIAAILAADVVVLSKLVGEDAAGIARALPMRQRCSTTRAPARELTRIA
jgi:hypothetical protein